MTTLTKNDLTHHALIVQTNDPTSALSLLENLLGVSFSHAAHQDVVFRSYESFGIDEVRELAFLSLQKPVIGDLLRIIVQSGNITTEAQHALLKQTEEPSEATRYIFILPSRVPILQTLRSRCAVVSLSESNISAHETAHNIAQDLKDITKITKDKNDTAMEVRLRRTEALLHTVLQHNAPLAEALIVARRYIESRGSSPKMLLEHLALTEHETKLQ